MDSEGLHALNDMHITVYCAVYILYTGQCKDFFLMWVDFCQKDKNKIEFFQHFSKEEFLASNIIDRITH